MSAAPTTSIDELADLSDPAVFAEGVPHETFDRLRATAPVHWQAETGRTGTRPGPGYWALTRHEDVSFVSKHADLFSSESGSVVLSDLRGRDLHNMRQQLINMDAPRHTQLRKLMSPHFRPGAVKGMVAPIERAVRQTLDAIPADGACDFVDAVSAPISLLGLTHLLGVPDCDADRFFHWTNKLIGASDPEVSSEWRGRLAVLEIFFYAGRMRRKRKRKPTDDIWSSLVNGEIDGAKLDRLTMNMNYFLLIIAGNETTRNALSGGMQALCEHPEQLAKLRADPSLLPGAIEEMLRWVTPVMQFRRTATRDLQIGDQEIAKGDKLVVYYGAANRDPAVFDDPHVFDITRSPNPHLAFGTGAHFCAGSHMARLEMRSTFAALLERFAHFELVEPPTRLKSNFISGIKQMPMVLR